MRNIYEYCPHCENEVELSNRFEVQICPKCGRPILPCSLCATCLGWNADCPLRDDEIKMNRELGFDD
ncbi:MAG: zinc-ribbon domain-containing protein [Alistipes sp.]|nr:zinc-ribbon domain-containing protein [Alistipes sp.]